MPELGVNIAIIRNDRILLIKREDFEVWGLPGGNIDTGESVAEAARREAREETGLDAALAGVVGVYSMPYWKSGGNHIVLFAAQPIGGELHLQKGEVLAADYFNPDELPEPLVWWHRQRILDALNGERGMTRSQNAIWPFQHPMTKEELYAFRDRSGLSRQEFFLKYLSQAEWE
ncbi:MAG: NUDIX domain-containing protein [Chloroflexota bacterium]|nr:NUDIX domain-containing protein [Chloroflexota bacterium]